MTTIQASVKVVAEKGQKQVQHVASTKWGILVTICEIIFAGGYTRPLVHDSSSQQIHSSYVSKRFS